MFWNHGKEPETRDIDARLFEISDEYLNLAKSDHSPFKATSTLLKLTENEIYPQLRLLMLKQIGSDLAKYAEAKLKKIEGQKRTTVAV